MGTLAGISAASQAKLPACIFSLPGYRFTGWNTQTDGGGTQYDDESTVEGAAVSDGETITLFAQWSPVSYSISTGPTVLVFGGAYTGLYPVRRADGNNPQ